MGIEAQLPGGTVLEFPDGTPDAVIDRVVRQHLGVGTSRDVAASAAAKRQSQLSGSEQAEAFLHTPAGAAATERMRASHDATSTGLAAADADRNRDAEANRANTIDHGPDAVRDTLAYIGTVRHNATPQTHPWLFRNGVQITPGEINDIVSRNATRITGMSPQDATAELFVPHPERSDAFGAHRAPPQFQADPFNTDLENPVTGGTQRERAGWEDLGSPRPQTEAAGDTSEERWRKFRSRAADLFSESFNGYLMREAEQRGPHEIQTLGGPPIEVIENESQRLVAEARQHGNLPGQQAFDAAAQDLERNAYHYRGTADYYAANTAESLVQMLPVLAAAVATRGRNLPEASEATGGVITRFLRGVGQEARESGPSLGVLYEQQAGQQYGQSRAEGRTVAEANQDATVFGFAEAIPEAIPLGVLMRPGGRFLPRFLQIAGAEGLSEIMTQAVEDGYTKLNLRPDMGWGDAWRDIRDAGIIGSLMGGGMTAVEHPFHRSPEQDAIREIGGADISGNIDMSARAALRPESTGNLRPPGVVESARPAPVTADDEASPLPTEAIAVGKQAMATAAREVEASGILDQAGYPGVGRRVAIDMGNGVTHHGRVEDAFTTDDEFGQNSGVRIRRDDGSLFEEYFPTIKQSGIRIYEPPREEVSPAARQRAPTHHESGTGVAPDIVNYLVHNGVDPEIARGVAAGVEAESGSNHSIRNHDSGAFGLGQWLGPRLAELHRRYGPDPTREQQLAFLLWELRGGDRGGGNVLNSRSAEEALHNYVVHFMRPAAGAETENDLARGRAALGSTGDYAAATPEEQPNTDWMNVDIAGPERRPTQLPDDTAVLESARIDPAAVLDADDETRRRAEEINAAVSESAAAMAQAPLDDTARRLFAQAIEAMRLDERQAKAIRLRAGTIAALAGRESIGRVHIAEALSYHPRPSDAERSAPAPKGYDAARVFQSVDAGVRIGDGTRAAPITPTTAEREAGIRTTPFKSTTTIDVNGERRTLNVSVPAGAPLGDGSRTAPVAVQSAADVDRAAARAEQPSEAQAEAGNYQKGHIRLHGLDITIETAKGTERSGTDPNGERWSVTMPAPYGYLKRTTGADEEQVDVYVGPNPQSTKVFVIDQVHADTGVWDEHKAALGFDSVEQALETYDKAFSDGRARERVGGVTEMDLSDFKDWLGSDQTEPIGQIIPQERAAAPPASETGAEARNQPAADEAAPAASEAAITSSTTNEAGKVIVPVTQQPALTETERAALVTLRDSERRGSADHANAKALLRYGRISSRPNGARLQRELIARALAAAEAKSESQKPSAAATGYEAQFRALPDDPEAWHDLRVKLIEGSPDRAAEVLDAMEAAGGVPESADERASRRRYEAGKPRRAELARQIVDAVRRGGRIVLASNERSLIVDRDNVDVLVAGQNGLSIRRGKNLEAIPGGDLEGLLREAERTAASRAAKVEYSRKITEATRDMPTPEKPASGQASTQDEWNAAREARIKMSKAEGNVHLDQVVASVETMRGREFHNVHDPKERGRIQTVTNRGDVYVIWSDDYSAEKNLAGPDHESSLMPSDLKDYVFGTPRRVASLRASSNRIFTEAAADKARALLKEKFAGTTLTSGLDPELAQAGLTLAGYHIEKGARTFAAYAKAMIDDLGQAVLPYLRSFYEAVRHYPGAEAFAREMSGPEDIGAALSDLERSAGRGKASGEETRNAGAAPEGRARNDDRSRDARDRAGAAPGIERGRDTGERAQGQGASGAGELRPGGRSGDGPGAEEQLGVGGQGERAPAGAEPGGRGRDRRGRGVFRGKAPGPNGGLNFYAAEGSLARAGSWRAAAERNLDIIELVNRLEAEGKPATFEQQKLLAAFTGWGAGEIRNNLFRSIVRDPQTGERSISPHAYGEWKETVERAAKLLKGDALETALQSTQYAHYTSEPVIRAMWGAAERLGFASGRILEPGAGIGLFAAAGPKQAIFDSTYMGIELDDFSARIAKLLLPQENVVHGDYVRQALPDGFFDLAIGNPPFADVKVLDDPAYKRQRFSLHDYFFAKTIDKVRPGGLMVFISSRYTMDKIGSAARDYIAGRADLLGAIRLPKTAFLKNAGTEVVTDIMFFQRRMPGAEVGGEAWVDTRQAQIGGQSFAVNEYFAAHPEMILGTPANTGSMYGKQEYTVEPKGEDLAAQLSAAIGRLPAEVYSEAPGKAAEAARAKAYERDMRPAAEKEGGLYVGPDGRVFVQSQGTGIDVRGFDRITETDVRWLAGYAGVRDALKEAQKDQLSEGAWEASLKRLNSVYDRFVKANGPISTFTAYDRTTTDEDGNSRTFEYRRFRNQRLLDLDVESVLVASLEKITEDGKIVKGPFLLGRTLNKPTRPSIESADDALAVGLDEIGHLDIDYVAGLWGKSRDETIDALGDRIFHTPSGEWQTSDEYLSGDVVQKLEEAEAAAAAEPAFRRNVDALAQAQPAPLRFSDISVKLGAGWVPAEVVGQFAAEVLGEGAEISYEPATAAWTVTGAKQRSRRSASAEYGTQDRSVLELLDANLNNRTIRVTAKVDGKQVENKDASAAAIEAAKKMADKFKSWVWSDGVRAAELGDLYNRRFNNLAPRKFDGSHLSFPGLSSRVKLRDLQKRVVWRIIQTGNTYTAHAVGAGKAQPLDAKVLTPTGWQRMGDIKIGDPVIAGDGTVTTVTAVYPQGDKPIFRVTLSDGSTTECCDEHLWHTVTYAERGSRKRGPKGQVRNLAEIRRSLIGRLGAKNHAIPMVGAAEFVGSELPLDPYLLGVILGDGCISGDNVTISSRDESIIDGLSLPPVVAARRISSAIRCPTWRLVQDTPRRATRTTNPVVAALRALGLMGTKSATKFIPRDYLFSGKDDRKALLQGLLDTDGSVSKRGHSVYFYSVSDELADGVQFIVQSLGGTLSRSMKIPAYVHNGERRHGQPCHVMCLRLPPDVAPFRLPRKAALVRPKSSYRPARYIVTVDPAGVKAAQCIAIAHPSHLYVTDDFIVTHNTLEMIVAGMEQRRLGLVKKPMYVVPNHMLNQFSREFLEAYPAASIMVADEKAFHTSNRKRFMAQAALNDPDAIIITHSAFGKIDTSDEARKAVITDMLVELERALDESDTRHGRRDIENQIEALKRRFAGRVGTGKDKALTFEEMGVDQLMVDEMHEFRKLDFATNRNEKGISSVGSQRALDLFIKIQWLEKQNPGRSIVGASGTPVTNTMAELYTVMRFIDLKGLERDGLRAFDAWANMFGEVVSGYEQNAAGGYEVVARFAKFVNVPELMKRVRSFMDVITSDQLGDLVERPKWVGGRPQNVVAPASPELKAYMDGELKARLKASRDWKPSKDEPVNLDPVINIITDARLAAIDMRFVDPSTANDPHSKLNEMIDKIIDVHHRTRDIVYINPSTGLKEPKRGATQIVFSPVGFGEQVQKNRGFDLRGWVQSRLKAAGIRPGDYAWMGDANTHAKKESLFKAMRAGTVRQLYGSPKNMGTGLNVQNRLIALHYLSPPWYPSDVEQPHGRIERQGNWNPEIEGYWYATKGTYDSTGWGMVSRKGRFIQQAMSGDDSIRSLDDISEVNQYEMAEALAAGDERVIRIAGLSSEIERLNRLQGAHFDQQRTLSGEKRFSERFIADKSEELAKLDKAVAARGDLHPIAIDVGGVVYDKPGEGGKALLAGLTPKAGTVATYQGHPVRLFHVERLNAYELGIGIADLDLKVTDPMSINALRELDPVGLAQRLGNTLARLPHERDRVRAQIAEHQTELKKIARKLGAPFEHEAELGEKFAERERIQAEMATETKTVAGPVGEAYIAADEEPALRRDQDAVPRGAEIRGLGIADEFARAGATALVGRTVSGARELAGLAQIYRNPRHETVRVFFVKDKRIVHATAVSARMPGMAPLLPGDDAIRNIGDWLNETSRTAGADGFYLLHNHPSGDPEPSREDISVTLNVIHRSTGFLGHVVINSNRYAVIDRNGRHRIYEKDFGTDNLLQPSKPHEALGQLVSDFSELATVAKTLQRPGFVTLIAADSKLRVRAVVDYPETDLDRPKAILLGALRGLMRRSGSTSIFLVGSKEAVSSAAVREAVKQHLLVETVDHEGAHSGLAYDRKSAISPLEGAPARFVAEAGRAFDPAKPEFTDPQTEERWQQATKGIGDGPGVVEKAKAWWHDVAGGFSRHWRALPNEPRFADLQQQLRKLEAAPEAAVEQAVRMLKDVVGPMNRSELDLFTRKVVLDDLQWETDHQHNLPFGFTAESMVEEKARIDAIVALDPKLTAAVRKRKLANKQVADAMVEAGVLTSDQVRNPAYFRHMVLDYARAEIAVAQGKIRAASGKKLKSPYWAKRMGSSLDINANLLEAEFEWMSKALVDVQTAKTIDWIRNSDHNIREDLRTKAKDQNKAGVAEALAVAEKKAASGDEAATAIIKREKTYRQMIAVGMRDVRAAVKNDELGDVPAHLEAAADAIAAGEKDVDGTFPLLAWILDNDKPGAIGAATALKAIGQRKAFFRDLLGQSYIDPDDTEELVKHFRPEGYARWQPREGRHLFTAKTISQTALDMFISKLADISVPGIGRDEMFRALSTVRSQLVVGGERYTMILPEEVAATLEAFGDRQAEGVASAISSHLQGAWKQYILINPRHFLKYNINNFSGDLDALVAGNPGALRKSWAAATELWRVMRGKQKPSQAYQDAIDRGVFTSGLTVQEIPDINRFSALRHLTQERSLRPDKLALQSVGAVWRALKGFTQWRENIFRYAAYLDYLEKIESGKPQLDIGYGASVPGMVDAVADPKDRAALLARDLIGDYGSISVAGSWLRKYLIPFWSWPEINTKRYWRLTTNAYLVSRARGIATGGLLGAGIAARSAAMLYFRMALVYGLFTLWNAFLFGDEERELSDLQKRQMHLILGRDSDGRVITLRAQGALSDVLGMLGLPDAMAGFRDYLNGQSTIGHAITDTLKAAPNRILTSARPEITVTADLITGQRHWPDITHPRPLHDPWRYIFSTFSLENEYDVAANRPSRGYLRSWTESVVYRRDPGEMSYDEARSVGFNWLERVRGQTGGGGESPKGEALRDYRMALRYHDQSAADAALARFYEYGGHDRGLEQSIRRAHPLGMIAKRDRRAYLASLTPEQLDNLYDAIEFYDAVYLGRSPGH